MLLRLAGLLVCLLASLPACLVACLFVWRWFACSRLLVCLLLCVLARLLAFLLSCLFACFCSAPPAFLSPGQPTDILGHAKRCGTHRFRCTHANQDSMEHVVMLAGYTLCERLAPATYPKPQNGVSLFPVFAACTWFVSSPPMVWTGICFCTRLRWLQTMV